MSGIGVALAFVIPASAATVGTGKGATPEAATQAAAADCKGKGLAAGPIDSQTELPEGGWEVTMTCVERTQPSPSGSTGVGTGGTQEEAHAAAKADCVGQGLVAGNLIGMEEMTPLPGDSAPISPATQWKATVECLTSSSDGNDPPPPPPNDGVIP